jgi:hypothetical protein
MVEQLKALSSNPALQKTNKKTLRHCRQRIASNNS